MISEKAMLPIIGLSAGDRERITYRIIYTLQNRVGILISYILFIILGNSIIVRNISLCPHM